MLETQFYYALIAGLVVFAHHETNEIVQIPTNALHTRPNEPDGAPPVINAQVLDSIERDLVNTAGSSRSLDPSIWRVSGVVIQNIIMLGLMTQEEFLGTSAASMVAETPPASDAEAVPA